MRKWLAAVTAVAVCSGCGGYEEEEEAPRPPPTAPAPAPQPPGPILYICTYTSHCPGTTGSQRDKLVCASSLYTAGENVRSSCPKGCVCGSVYCSKFGDPC